MHFHLPKPLHGWRAFAGEVGIIVLGVLIALGAEQLAEGVHRRGEVAELQRGVRAELANDRARWDSIHQQAPCALERLAALDEWVRSAPPSARLVDLRGPRIWSLHLSAWDMAKGSNAFEYVPLSDRLRYSELYDAMLNLQVSILNSLAEWKRISALAANADQSSSRQGLREAVASARYDVLYRERVNYIFLSKRFDGLGIKPDASGLTTASTGDNVDARELCAPLPR
jgi:hypothetical protein